MALDRILVTKREEVAARRAALPLERVREGLEPSDRPFEAALRSRRPAFICEIKPASPSEGPIRPADAMGPAIETYARHADAVSVLTDATWFGGSFDLLRRVRRSVSQPVLCKDFVLDPYQVYEARRAGADAVLLMLSVLDDAAWRDCARAAAECGMGILTEAHSAAETDRAVALGAPVIGLNNRNLGTLAVDLATTPALAARVPADRVLIAESGIRTRADVTRLRPLVDGFLVGTALMRAADPDAALRDLVYGWTKVCGLTRPEDARHAADRGATHGGLIFAPESPRRVTPRQALAIRRAAPLRFVGVFVNESSDRVAELAQTLDLAAVQLHGEETPDVLDRLRRKLPDGVEIWKAVRVVDTIPANAWNADRLLLDRYDPASRGGTGRPFDWSVLEGVTRPDGCILSGGVGPDNLARALATGLDAFDVNSAVESAPGEKDPVLLDRLMAARRQAGPQESRS
ncbi:MAG: bifunctional indole-3-glycerol-phosphate synthase TrpC/phosphoribosylanthranilate isomerase TrpF [Gemmatimonadales bacterium]